MTLIVKLMIGDGVADDDTRAGHRLLTGVTGVRFDRHPETGAVAELTFASGEQTTYTAWGNIYVMNESGRTVSSFSPEPLPGSPVSKWPSQTNGQTPEGQAALDKAA